MNRDAKKAGFTLIELLIVVAIIAILAAIAVPNFLEAQMRAKVARVKSDLRTVRLAMEAYAIDCNGKYPHLPGNQSAFGATAQVTRGPLSAAYPLSTPVAYLTTTYMIDPFCPERFWNQFGYISLSNQSGNLQTVFSYVNARLTIGAAWKSDRPAWWCVSLGPDYMMGPDARTGSKVWTTTNYGTQLDGPTANVGKSEFAAWMYDPSNGTKSNGDIWVNQSTTSR